MSIGERLNEFAVKRHGSKHGYKTLFAKELGMTSNTLSHYLNDKLLPGNGLQQKLRELGCDIEWLMTGREMKTVAVYPREYVEQSGFIPVTEEPVPLYDSAATIEQLRAQINLLNKYNDDLKNDLINKNAELTDKKKIIALLEDKILTMGTAALGNENSNMQTPLQVLQKIK